VIDIVVLNDHQEEIDDDDSNLIIDILQFAYQFLELKIDYEMSVNLVDNKKIQEINNDYRNTDSITDVISFALEETDQIKINGLPHELGDLFISLEKAKTQSLEFNHTYKRELAFLAVHGFLHLLGYDHTKSTDDEKIMFNLQGEILTKYGIGR
jgi:probable rRNA maturation factor